jgi:hypothetical protein|tara:strand:- start:2057 stop:2170 length:114 start_codon:yes stop_codon:yes gene_type:complete
MKNNGLISSNDEQCSWFFSELAGLHGNSAPMPFYGRA